MSATSGGRRVVRSMLAVAWCAGPALAAGADAPLVIEHVQAGGRAAEAGLRAGDELIDWDAPPASPRRRSWPLHAAFVESEYGPRGTVRVGARRAGRSFGSELAGGAWGMAARPALAASVHTSYEEGRRALAAGDPEGATTHWRAAAAEALRRGESPSAVWLLARLGAEWSERARWDLAAEAYQEALSHAATSDDVTRSVLWEGRGRALLSGGGFAGAEEALTQMAQHAGRVAPAGLAVATALALRGDAAVYSNKLGPAEADFREALASRKRLLPEGPGHAECLMGLGEVARRRADPAAEALARDALRIVERDAPDGLLHSRVLRLAGAVATYSEKLEEAEAHLRQALTIQERLAPGSLVLASTLNALGAAAMRAGRTEAEEFFRRALGIWERLAPDSLLVSGGLNNLGALAAQSRDFARAEDYYRRSVAIRQRLAPDSLSVAGVLNNLALMLIEQGRTAEGEAVNRRALAIQERLAPGTLEVARSLAHLGNLAWRRRDQTAVEDFYRRALEIQEKVIPTSADGAGSMFNLGQLALDRGDLPKAEGFLEQALATQRNIAHGHPAVAQYLNGVGRLRRRQGRAVDGRSLLAQAVQHVEIGARSRDARQDIATGFAAVYANVYRDLVEALVEDGQPAEAFRTAEQFRARSFLTMLAERDLLVATLPEHLERERQEVEREYSEAAYALLGTASGAASERDVSHLHGVARRREDLLAKLRQASPAAASVHYPSPLDVPATQTALDPGTVLLSYSMGRERTVLFAVTKRRFQAFVIPWGEEAVRQRVDSLRRALGRAPGRTVEDAGQAEQNAYALYEALVAPAAPLLASAARIAISPDGPLHVLPFAALQRRPPSAGKGYLIEWKPIHVVPSVTVAAELKKLRARERPDRALVAFGAPENHGGSIVARRAGFEPLPFAQREVEALGALFPGRASVFVGEEATEERAKALGPHARYVHFAGHGILDERAPLNSALVLRLSTPPRTDGDDGLLQAWEIFDRVRLRADLVTLAACESALGREQGHEGLIGLTRAFLYSGSRSVAASLWSVSDRSTALLMTSFYRHLKRGLPKDQALQAAQLTLLRATGTGHVAPFHWAAFQLYGDWM